MLQKTLKWCNRLLHSNVTKPLLSLVPIIWTFKTNPGHGEKNPLIKPLMHWIPEWQSENPKPVFIATKYEPHNQTIRPECLSADGILSSSKE